MGETPGDDPATTASDHGSDRSQHYYGGQAVIEGVMMRGRRHWALAVRLPDERIHVESHDIDSVAARHPVWNKPGLRGVVVLGQSLAIGFRALTRAAQLSSPEDAQLSRGAMAATMAIAVTLFLGLFIVFPAFVFGWLDARLPSGGLLLNIGEGIFRVALFLGYLLAISRARDIRRVFEYHGAEHKTIAAYEHHEPLVPDRVDRYSTLHVRCGTNFLLIVMVLTILIFSLFGSPALPVRIGSRILAIPLIAAFAYEMLRLGARFPDSWVMRVIMRPGLWLQRITTKPPSREQVDVAIASFNEVLRAETDGAAPKGRALVEGVGDPGSPGPPAT